MGSKRLSRTGRQAIELVARIGYTARGVVFLLIGVLAAAAAIEFRHRAVGDKGAFLVLVRQPLGEVLLFVVALGLLCFAIWRALQALLDLDGHGRSPKGLLRRLVYGANAVFYLALSVWAASLAVGLASRGQESDAALRDWTAWLMAQPLGRWLVAAIGASIVATGLAIGFKAFTGEFDRRFSLDAEPRRWIVLLGRIGILARGVVFTMIGGFLIMAAVHANSAEARGLAGSLHALQTQPYGAFLLAMTALGLIAFAAFELSEAAFRRISPPRMARRGSGLASLG
jgi:hypothetical protein